MLDAALLVWCALGAAAAGGIYRVERQDFSSPSPTGRSISYQNLVNGRPGVYKVNRQEFAGGSPFSPNGPPFGGMHGYYPQQKALHPYGEAGNGYQLPASTVEPALPPRLFVPAESGEFAGANYKNVLSLAEYNRRFEAAPSSPSYFHPPAPSQTSAPAYLQPQTPVFFRRPAPSVPAYLRPSAESPTAVPAYLRPLAESSTAVPAYLRPSAEAPTSVPAYLRPPAESPTSVYAYLRPLAESATSSSSQPPVTPYWTVAGASSASRLPTATPPPLRPAPAFDEDDGILAPIPSNDEENKPLPPVVVQDAMRKPHVTEDAAGNRHTKVRYHSFDDFVEVSDEHRELLESFGSIQNNESDFSELPEASPIRRRRNTSHSQVFSMFSVRDSRLPGAAAVLDPEQLICRYVNQLRQQIDILDGMKKAIGEAKLRQRSAKSSPRTVVAADDSTVVVFDGANLDGKSDQLESAEDLPRAPLADGLTSCERAASREANSGTEPADSTMEATSDGSHEVLLQRDEGAAPTSDPRQQIVYLTEPFKMATRSSAESWED